MTRDGVARVLRRGRPGPYVCALLLAVLVTACGKKGPPLAPLRLIPEAPSDVSLRRVGNKAILNFTLPKKNANGPGAVDLDRVEIYAITAGPGALVPPNRDLLTRSYLVGTISVKPPTVEDQAPDPKASDDKRPSPGDAVTFSEELNEDTMRPAPLKLAPPPRSSQPAAAGGQSPAGNAGPPAAGVPPAPAAAQAPAAPQPPPPAAGGRAPSTVAAAQVASTSASAYPVRVYVLRGLTRRGRGGAPGPRMQLPLVPLPSPPVDVVTMFTEHAVALAWTPPVTDNIDGFASALPVVPVAVAHPDAAAATEGAVPASGAPLPVPALPAAVPATTAPAPVPALPEAVPATAAPVPVPPLPAAAPASGAVAAPSVPQTGPAVQPAAQPASGGTNAYTFNVYEAGGDVPLNKAPLSTGFFRHEGAPFGQEQCFAVRSVSTTANVGIEGEPSKPVCLTPRDIFPPAAPRGLNAVAGPGAISLIWDANAEPDLAGYLVLRGEAPGGTLQPLTPSPIRETNYRDATVTAGVRYVYVVIAVDSATPPNTSPPTARVEETAR